MYLAYTVLLAITMILALPWILVQIVAKKKFRRGFMERIGRIKYRSGPRPPGGALVWFHASSVGEVLAAMPVIRRIQAVRPDARQVLSVVTDTGYEIAREKIRELDYVFRAPLDFPWIVWKVLNSLEPACLIILETELWPGLICLTHDRGIPVLLINGRISDRTFPRYRKVAGLLKRILRRIDAVAAQSPTDADRFIRLGARPERVIASGNVKYDQPEMPLQPEDRESLLKALNASRESRIIVAGSTHEGEEEIFLSVYRRLKDDSADIKLVLVPRHLDRLDSIRVLLNDMNLEYRLHSESSPARDSRNPDILLVDKMGELTRFYALADIAFVGGSLVDIGGHNVLEPAIAGKPVLFGPHTQNFRSAVDQLLSRSAGIEVADAGDLLETLRGLLADPERCRELGSRAREVVRENSGAVIRATDLILEFIPGADAPADSAVEPKQHQRRPEDCLFESPRTPADRLLHGAACILQPVYSAAVRSRNVLYSRGVLRSHRVDVPVVSIGNLTVGGTGKTPLTLLTAGILTEYGCRPVVLMRGYGGRKGRVPELVPVDGNYRDWGDEPVMIRRELKDVPVVVCRDRFAGARWTTRNVPCDCFILDDGYQHIRLERDYNVLILDARKPISDEKILPAGRLREPVSGLSRADAVVFSHSDARCPDSRDLELIRKFNPESEIYLGNHELSGLRWAGTSRSFDLDLEGQSGGVLTAIADPDAFIRTVENLDIKICSKTIFPDHHPVSPSQWLDAVEQTTKTGGKYLFTTFKDEVRLPRNARDYKIPILVADITFRIQPEDEYREQLKSLCIRE
ncbi:tetraacyldisaccharide 4'-kinase [bacterium]|nr:tetraacyldisaccharide 4'-kinase [candidate division CSSED10-310 bacterium]